MARDDEPYGQLMVMRLTREYLQPSKVAQDPEVREAAYNLRNISLALQMYLGDYDDRFSMAEDTAGLRRTLGEYVRDQRVFMRPGTEDEVVVTYLADPGTRLVDIENPSETPVAIIDYREDFYAVAYANGWVELFERR